MHLLRLFEVVTIRGARMSLSLIAFNDGPKIKTKDDPKSTTVYCIATPCQKKALEPPYLHVHPK